MTARLSVIVPAHNEAKTIGPALRRMLDGGDDRLEVIVAANGCTDDTASLSRAVSPQVTVLELGQASKAAALNVADAHAAGFPRAYVDADIDVDGATLCALADLLERPDGPLIAAPTMRLDLRGCTWAVRAYYAAWQRTSFRLSGHTGSGLYALSMEGRARFDSFPQVIADDRYVQQRFSVSERGELPGHHFVVRPPRTIRALVHRGARIVEGNRQLHELGLDQRPGGEGEPAETSGVRSLLPQLPTRPQLWMPFLVYCSVQLATRVVSQRNRRRGDAALWHRDETSRA